MESKDAPSKFPSDTQGALIVLIGSLVATRSELLDRCGDREVVTTMMDNIISVMDEIVGGVAIQARVPEPSKEAKSALRWSEAVKRIYGTDTKISHLMQTILHPPDLRLIDRYHIVVVEHNQKTYALEAAFTYLRTAAQKAFAAVDAKNNAAAAVAEEEKIRGKKSILLRAIDSLRCKDIVNAEAISDLQQQVRELDRSLPIWPPECSPEQYCGVVDAIMESAQREHSAPAQYCDARAVFVATDLFRGV